MQENGMRAGTENVAGIVAMAYALKENYNKINENTKHLKLLETELINELNTNKIDFIRNGINQLPGNLSLSFKGVLGETLLHRLDLKGICISTGSACDSQSQKASHVIEAIKIPDEYKYGTIRISLGSENTLDEVRFIASSISSIIQER